MGARHVSQLGSLLKAEAGRRYYVVEAGARVFSIYTREGNFQQQVEGFDVDKPNRAYELRSSLTTKTLAKMSVQSLPGCCGVCVLHSFSGEPKYVTEFIRTGIRAAKRAGYGQVLFTLRSDSQILQSFVPEDIHPELPVPTFHIQFRNGKTNNSVTLVTVHLPQAERTARRDDTAGE